MAPVLEKKLLGAAGAGDNMENSNEDEEGQNLWQVQVLVIYNVLFSVTEKLFTNLFNVLCHCRVLSSKRSRMPSKQLTLLLTRTVVTIANIRSATTFCFS